MSILADKVLGTPTTEPVPNSYSSNVLRLFFQTLKGLQGVQLLDIGPVSNDNINFIARRAKKLWVCDMFVRLDRERRKGLPGTQTWRHLNCPPQTFDGILLWDLMDRLGAEEGDKLADLCHTLLKPQGLAVVMVLGTQRISTGVNAFVIEDGFRIHFRPQPHLDLPLHGRQNRDIISAMSPLAPIKSFIYQEGLREFLFKRD